MEKRHKPTMYLLILFFASILIISTSLPVLAHKVIIFAWVEGDTVFTESKFSGGRKAAGARILVFDRAGKQLLEGETNDKGEFSFKIPKLTDLRIALTAGMGHKGEWIIPESEIKEAGDVSEKKMAGESSQPIDIGLSKEEIKELIEESLDRKLRPIVRMITESQSKGPTINEIIGGIGYIFGLMGVAIYFKNRGTKRREVTREN
jgi:nickel transport protein